MSKSRSLWARASLILIGLSVAACSAASDPDESGSSGSSDDPHETIKPISAAPGVSLSEIALYQGVKRPLVAGGVPAATDIPVVAHRDALMRVFLQSDGTFQGPITGRLYLGAGDPIEVTSALPAASTDADLGSTLNFELPGDAINETLAYRLEIGVLGGASGAPPPLVYPAQGSEPIPVASVGETLKIVIVPVQYGADGSGRLPDVSDAQIALYTQGFGAMYPVPHVEITVHAPYPWDSTVGAFGQGWDFLLSAIGDLRMQEGAPPDVYYYGAFAPANSFGQYCQQGCVAGLGMSGGPGDTFARAAIGLGFTGEMSVSTALHETGHNHGRQHSPCQTQDPDPSYPYPNGSDGVWGYDRGHQMLFPPTAADIMGYCTPSWISDWTYKALFERIRIVNGAPSALVIGGAEAPRVYERAILDAEGKLHPLAPLTMATPPLGEERVVHPPGRGAVTAHFYGFDHLPGGILFWEH